MERIIKARNIVLQYAPLDQELSGMAYIKDGVGIIGVNALHHPNRQRFSAANTNSPTMNSMPTKFEKQFMSIRPFACCCAGRCVFARY